MAAALALSLLIGLMPAQAGVREPDCLDTLLPPFALEAVPSLSDGDFDEDRLLPPRIVVSRSSRSNPDLLPPGALGRASPGRAAQPGPGVVGLAFDELLPPGAVERREAPADTGSGDELLPPSGSW